MDPLSIASAVTGVTAACYTTAKSIHNLQGKFEDAPTTIVSISSEMAVISASLAHIQGILLQRRELADDTQGDIGYQRMVALDTSLTGCLVLFTCLDQEIASFNMSNLKGGQLRWVARFRLLINNDRLQGLLTALRGQQTAISLLIQLIQTETISELKGLPLENKATLDASIERSRTMRASPRDRGKTLTESVLGRDKLVSPHGRSADVYSHVAVSDIEFDFDDVVVNSRTYRRAMAAAKTAGVMSTDPSELAAERGRDIEITDAIPGHGPLNRQNSHETAPQEAGNDTTEPPFQESKQGERYQNSQPPNDVSHQKPRSYTDGGAMAIMLQIARGI